ncbi:MAG: hypothetical protein FJ403_07020 [Verrucomicrobia bacterium]|nr:hypothetical protein [Verrucomicrobiota bacterium]
MNLLRIRERLTGGFKPFVIELSSGRRLEVPHPEFVIVGRNVVGVLTERDVIVSIDPLHIVSVEDLPVKKRK